MTRTKVNIVLAILPHISLWGFFTLLFYVGNTDASADDYWNWFIILGLSALQVYINLYILLPRLFFTKKYLVYVLFLLLSLTLISFVLNKLTPEGQGSIGTTFSQHFLNLIFFVILTSSFAFYKEYSVKQKALIRIENEQLKTELNFLKSQIHPHFLFNTLNNLYGLITQNDNKRAAEATLKLAELTRYLLDSSKSEKVSLKKELQFIEDYLSLEKIRLSKDTDVQFDVSGCDKDIYLAPFLFIPLVENTFKHGLQTLSENNFAHFSLAIQGNDLFFEARNSNEKKNEHHPRSGTGLANLKKRLQLIYPKKHQLDIENTENYYKVTLHIEL
ncbi:MAG: sensor histidine kinase [Flavobacteriales bacterium]|jgi:sensor histidine kinase YesM